jgi:thiol-disulfide isomerase/thioredoxin
MKKYIIIGIAVLALFLLSSCSVSQAETDANNIDAETIGSLIPSYGVNKGDIPPDFTIKSVDGEEFNINALREEKKPVLLYFFASWCPYCSQDFSVVKEIYPEYADKVTFLAIDLDLNEGEKLIREYRDKKNVPGVDFAAGSIDILADYGIAFTTTKYAIGKDGLILYKGSGVFNEQQWRVLLNGLADS